VPRLDVTEQCAKQRSFAHAVPSHQANGFAGPHRKIDAMQNMAGAIEAVEAAGIDDWSVCHTDPSVLPR
jgi:hypothetical protein